MSPSNAEPRGVFAQGPPANATQSCLRTRPRLGLRGDPVDHHERGAHVRREPGALVPVEAAGRAEPAVGEHVRAVGPEADQPAEVRAGRRAGGPPFEVAGGRVHERPGARPRGGEAGLHRGEVGQARERAAGIGAGTRRWPRRRVCRPPFEGSAASSRPTPTRGVDRLGPDEHGRSDGPRARERAGHRLRRNGRRAAARAPPQRELVGARGFRRAAPAPAAVVPLLPARRPGPCDHPLGRRRRLPLRLARRRPRGVRRRHGAGDVPSARVLDGRRDRAPVRGSSSRAAAVARRHRDLARARAADVRRAADDGPGLHRARPALGGRPVPAARSRAGTRCLAPADAGHRAGRRRAAPPRAGRPDPDRRPDAGRRRRP